MLLVTVIPKIGRSEGPGNDGKRKSCSQDQSCGKTSSAWPAGKADRRFLAEAFLSFAPFTLARVNKPMTSIVFIARYRIYSIYRIHKTTLYACA